MANSKYDKKGNPLYSNWTKEELINALIKIETEEKKHLRKISSLIDKLVKG